MSGRVIGFIVLTAILGHRAGRARGRRDVPRGHHRHHRARLVGAGRDGRLHRLRHRAGCDDPARASAWASAARCRSEPLRGLPLTGLRRDGGGCRRARPVQVRAVQRDDGEGRHERDLRALPAAALPGVPEGLGDAPRADHLGHRRRRHLHLRERRDGGADDRTSPEVGEGPGLPRRHHRLAGRCRRYPADAAPDHRPIARHGGGD
jgi:hypothetical protein